MSQQQQQPEQPPPHPHDAFIKKWLEGNDFDHPFERVREVHRKEHVDRRVREGVQTGRFRDEVEGVFHFLNSWKAQILTRHAHRGADPIASTSATAASASAPQPAAQPAANSSGAGSKAIKSHGHLRAGNLVVWEPKETDVEVENLRLFWSKGNQRSDVKQQLYLLLERHCLRPYEIANKTMKWNRGLLWWRLLLTDLAKCQWSYNDVDNRQAPKGELEKWLQEWGEVMEKQFGKEKYGL
ncbi:MAG: hypothetical protein Q9162_006745 [Coniocarpon cinnabarinum]